MVFSSIPFIFFFLPIFLLIYYLVPFKLKNYILLVFSLIFYAWGEPVYVLLMLFSCFINYYSGILINKYENKRKLILIISIVLNLGILGFYKYSDFLIQNINNIFSLDISLLELALPIGISFFTFQAMSYTIDIYNKKVKIEKNFFTFATYISMFPQLIAGPIVRYETVSEELKTRTINYENFSKGMFRFLQGLFKKVLIANNIGLLFTTLTNFPTISVLGAWLAIISFTLQIYFDFSGYSDMAIGMGKMLGFNYLENFNYPYIAKSITDFWRRWHISLSTWFKDYLYIPLGGNKCSKIKNIRNILIVWCLTGLWHGSAWNFIIWGLYFGIILILEKFVINRFLEKRSNLFKHIYTLILIMIGWLIFAFDDINILEKYAKAMIDINTKLIDQNALYYLKNYFIIILIGIIFSTPFLSNVIKKLNNSKKQLLIFIVSLVVVVGLFIITISCLVNDTYNPFLYFRF